MKTLTERADVAPRWIQAIGGRKFLLAATVILVASVGLFLSLVGSEQWLTAVGIAVGSFSAANAATHWSNRPSIAPMLGASKVSADDIRIDPNAG